MKSETNKTEGELVLVGVYIYILRERELVFGELDAWHGNGEKKEKEKEGAKLRVVLLLGLVESGRNE